MYADVLASQEFDVLMTPSVEVVVAAAATILVLVIILVMTLLSKCIVD